LSVNLVSTGSHGSLLLDR